MGELSQIRRALGEINGELGEVFRRLGRVEKLTMTLLIMVVLVILLLTVLLVFNLIEARAVGNFAEVCEWLI